MFHATSESLLGLIPPRVPTSSVLLSVRSVPFEILLGLPSLTSLGDFNVMELSGQLLSVSLTVTSK